MPAAGPNPLLGDFFLLPLLTHLGTVLLPQGRNESLHGLVLNRDLVDVQIHVIPQPQLLQLLKHTSKAKPRWSDTRRAEDLLLEGFMAE